MFAKKNIRFD